MGVVISAIQFSCRSGRSLLCSLYNKSIWKLYCPFDVVPEFWGEKKKEKKKIALSCASGFNDKLKLRVEQFGYCIL